MLDLWVVMKFGLIYTSDSTFRVLFVTNKIILYGLFLQR